MSRQSRSPSPARELAESGFFVAGALVLTLLGSMLLPPLLYFLPTPLAVVTRRRGWGWGTMAAVVAAALSFAFLGAGATSVLVLGVAGVVLGGVSRQAWPAIPVVMVGGVALALGIVGLFAAWAGVAGQSLTAWYGQLLDALHKGVVELYQQTLSGADQERAIAQATALLAPLRLLWPAALLLSSAGLALVNYGLMRLVLARVGDPLPPLPAFSRWHLPWPFLWGWIGGLLALYLAHRVRGPLGAGGTQALQTIGLNLQATFGLLYAMEGLSLVWFWLERNRVVTLWRWLLVVVAFLWPPVWMGLMLAGALDSWFDWRKVERRAD